MVDSKLCKMLAHYSASQNSLYRHISLPENEPTWLCSALRLELKKKKKQYKLTFRTKFNHLEHSKDSRVYKLQLHEFIYFSPL